MKRTLSLLLVLIMVISMIPNVFAANNDEIEFDDLFTYTDNEDGATHTVETAPGETYVEDHNFVDGTCICGALEVPPCDHAEMKYTDNGNGTHNGACECGEVTVENEAHSYTDGKCVCGAVEVIECQHTNTEVKIENEVPSTWQTVGSYDEVTYCAECEEELSRVKKDALLNPFYNNAMELSSQLTLHVIIKVDTLGLGTNQNAIKESGYYAVVTRIDENGNPVETEIPASAWESHTNNRMRIPYEAWNPTQMADQFGVVLYNDNDEVISVAHETSVRAVAMDEIKKGIDSGSASLTTYVTMLVDMLNYGAASQLRFTYNQDDYANALLTDEMKAYATKDVAYGAAKNNSGAAVYQSTAMELGSRVEMQLVLWNDAFGVDLEQVKAKITYTSFDGTLIEKTVSGGDFSEHTKKNGRERSKLVINWLDVPDCTRDVTIVFMDSEENEIATVTECMLSALGTYYGVYPDVPLYSSTIKFINSTYTRFAG